MKTSIQVFPLARLGFGLTLWLVMGLTTSVYATAHIPAQDDIILEKLPTEWLKASTSTKQLREAWQMQPEQPAAVQALAQHYIEIGREQADPRYYGYAEALLKPWKDKPLPNELLFLRAHLHQHAHRYDVALQDLKQLLQQQPSHSQAWLTQAMIQSVQGDYTAAKQSCHNLANQDTWSASLCYSHVMALTGQAEQAYALQLSLSPTLKPEEPALHQWLQTLLAETAWRLGNNTLADQHFQKALAQPRRDTYLLRVYSDFLLAENRPESVIPLLQDNLTDGSLLLRMALASQQLKQDENTQKYRSQLEARYTAIRLRGDSPERDTALYLLAFEGDKAQALQIAQANWQIQKEPEDTVLLLQAALANQDWQTLKQLRDWLANNQQQDQRYKALLAPLATQTQTSEIKP